MNKSFILLAAVLSTFALGACKLDLSSLKKPDTTTTNPAPAPAPAEAPKQ